MKKKSYLCIHKPIVFDKPREGVKSRSVYTMLRRENVWYETNVKQW